jgi:hypothetical protein
MADFLRALLEIGILWIFYYGVLLFFQGSVAVQVLRGVVVLALVFLVAGLLNLTVITWLFTKIVPLVAIAFIVIFHPELRRGLARIGGEALLRLAPRHEQVVEEVMAGPVTVRPAEEAVAPEEGPARTLAWVREPHLVAVRFPSPTPQRRRSLTTVLTTALVRSRLIAARLQSPGRQKSTPHQ